MANNAEGIGALIATSTLMKGERQLLLKPNMDAAGESEKTAAQQPGAAIANDSKSVASLLLTLLDDRLAAEAARPAAAGSERPAAEQAQDTSRRIAAAYTDEGQLADPNRADAVAVPAQGPLPNASPIAAPELQTFLQRLAAFATGRMEADQASRAGGGRRRAPAAAEGTAIYRMAGAILIAWWLGMFVAQWIFK